MFDAIIKNNKFVDKAN